MPYTKTVWVNGSTPALEATNLNKIEQGIADSFRIDGTTTMTGQIVTVAGSATTPAIAPTGDSNNGIFFPAVDTIALGTAGSERVRVTSAGNVGIGTTSPDVFGRGYSGTILGISSAGQSAIQLNSATGNAAYLDLGVNGSRLGYVQAQSTDLQLISVGSIPLYLGTNNAVRATITSAGNVGIGTTSPSAKLELSDGTVIGQIDPISSSLYFGTKSNHPIILFTNNTEKVRVDTSGNLGVGVSPNAKLHVKSAGETLRLETTSATGDNFVRFYAPSATTLGYLGYTSAGNNNMNVNQVANADLLFHTNNTERMRLISTGYLLVGYTASNGAYPLQVNGQIFATSSTIATSDQRYKENITPLTGALSLVNALNPVQFDWKQHPVHNFNTEQPTVGFLAQEVAEVLKDQPYLNSVIKKSECTWETETGEFVDVTKQVEVDGELVDETVQEAVKQTHTEEFYGIAESNLIAILTKAVQELSAELQALKAQING